MDPFFCYYGGKWRTAPRYPKPEYPRIVEPFAGAAGYATRHADRAVILVERDPVIAGLWKYLTRVRASEIRALPDVPHDGSVDDIDACQEARWLIGFWLNKGSSTPKKRPSSRMLSGVRPKSHWGPEIRERIAAQVDGIRHWYVIEGSYADFPNCESTWFVDPPYEGAGRHYAVSGLDYLHLAEWCRARDGQTIVCENVDASWLPFEPFMRAKACASTGKKFSEEAIWTAHRVRRSSLHCRCAPAD